MFVFTAKLNKKKLTACLIGVLAVILLIVVVLTVLSPEKSAGTGAVTNAADAANYLRALGWEPEEAPLEVQELVIPRSFSDVYEKYAALQAEQGFELERYGGMKATRYTFRLTNYPGGGEVVADLLVCGTAVIAGDVQSTALNGFMETLTAHAPGG